MIILQKWKITISEIIKNIWKVWNNIEVTKILENEIIKYDSKRRSVQLVQFALLPWDTDEF